MTPSLAQPSPTTTTKSRGTRTTQELTRRPASNLPSNLTTYDARGNAVRVAETSALFVLISVIAKKTGAKWLSEFTLAICLIGAMCLSVLWAGLFA